MTGGSGTRTPTSTSDVAAGSVGVAAIGRVLTAMATPFSPTGALDLAGAAVLARHLVATGSDGIVVGGTTGESPTLRDAELWDLVDTVRDAVAGAARIIVGTGTNDTARSVERTVRAAQAGVDGALVVTPYYNRPSQRGLVAHLTAVADATPLPILLYDIPVRTGRELTLDTLVTLAQSPNVVGVKDATADLAKAAEVVTATRGAPGGFDVWSGADEVNLPLLSVGAVGIVSVSAHLAGPELAEMVACFPTDPLRARELHLRCLPLHRALFLDANPGPLKLALAARGLPAGPVRPPLAEADSTVRDQVLAALTALEAARAD
jgi:4-hydroxy-tetrahydrodipicolinate synthase